MDALREIVVATRNPHKVDEIRAVLGALGVRLRSLDEAGYAGPEPEETGETFEANAALKARFYALATGGAVLADDSGLEVDALGGEPGVRSAHWAGLDGTRAERDARNNAKLLAAMESVPDARRGARFVCVLALADAEGRIRRTARGTMAGAIARSARGSNGFGYDPLFRLPDLGCTSAELDQEAKNLRSHRGAALRALVEALRGEISAPGS